MTSMMQARIHELRRSALALLCLCMILPLAGCGAPDQDGFRSAGGISPDPTGILAGSVLYVGPRPNCEYKGTRASRVMGRVVLTLFLYDNPPVPEGRATGALNVMFINPEGLFSLSDCLPKDQPADPDAPRITRSVPFEWPQVALGTTAEVAYQVRGFYDADEDMIPFFSVRNQPTQGDIVGAALADPPAAGYLRIVLPSRSDGLDGFRRQGIIVSLGNYVWLERGAYQLSERRFMPATSTVAARLVPGTANIDIAASLQANWSNNTCDGQPGCGLTLDQLDQAQTERTLGAAGVGMDFDPEHYAFVSEPVDVATIVTGGPDLQRPDGQPDPHPLLGANLGVPYYTPIVIMTRSAPTAAMQGIETSAAIPPVRLIGSVLIDNAATAEERPKPIKRVKLGSIEVAVPAIALVELDPANTQCRIPYLAPGNFTRSYEARLSQCADLPTGLFNVSAIQGVGGGKRVEQPDQAISDTGWVYDGARLPGQSWTVVNDLGNPLQVGAGNELASQSAAGAFVVYDPDLEGQASCVQAIDPTTGMMRDVDYKGLCESEDEYRIENPAGQVGEGIDGAACLPAACCAAIEHLCGVPLCEPCTQQTCPGLPTDDNPVRQGPTFITGTGANKKLIPDCLPFPMPSICCPE